jgi:hypothetical protein
VEFQTKTKKKSSEKGYEEKLAIPPINLKFTPFDIKSQFLMRQEVRLLSEKHKMMNFFFLFILKDKFIHQ